MATLLAHIAVRPGMADRFEEIARGLYASTHELEPRVRRYEYWRGAEENTYYSLLSFESFADFLAHQTSDHHESASPALGQVISRIRLEWVDPIAGASPLGATKPGEAFPESSQLARDYAVRFAAQVADWWLALR
ncbi:unannotated protein [freshwater metagenome]|uniref:Unannotated protein n=1 Tax=freshwater metagenome TaxID=449393 RepID=A0A6J7ERD3_9ZZZZ|nr:hypothetical protein [Actinomycetota bacterium]